MEYRFCAGNKTDVTTVQEIVGTMEARYGQAQRIWVMDRGMTSAANLAWLRQTERRYLVGTPKSELRKWAAQIAEPQDWFTVREDVEAKRCAGPDGTETFILIRSVERREKERAMHQRFAARIETGLTRLARRLAQARRPLERGPLERQLGRLLGRNSRAAARYLIEGVSDASRPSGLRLDWSPRPDWDDWARHSEGCYVLRSNIPDWSPEDLWRTYIQLTDAEAAFRIQKSESKGAPIPGPRLRRWREIVIKVLGLRLPRGVSLSGGQRREAPGLSASPTPRRLPRRHYSLRGSDWPRHWGRPLR